MSTTKKNKEQDLSDEDKKQIYHDLFNLIEQEEILTETAHYDKENNEVVVTIRAFDIPLKQVKLDMEDAVNG